MMYTTHIIALLLGLGGLAVNSLPIEQLQDESLSAQDSSAKGTSTKSMPLCLHLLTR